MGITLHDTLLHELPQLHIYVVFYPLGECVTCVRSQQKGGREGEVRGQIELANACRN